MREACSHSAIAITNAINILTRCVSLFRSSRRVCNRLRLYMYIDTLCIQEFEESLQQAEFEAEMREVESAAAEQQQEAAVAMGFYQPEQLDTQTVDQVQLIEPVTDATMQDE